MWWRHDPQPSRTLHLQPPARLTVVCYSLPMKCTPGSTGSSRSPSHPLRSSALNCNIPFHSPSGKLVKPKHRQVSHGLSNRALAHRSSPPTPASEGPVAGRYLESRATSTAAVCTWKGSISRGSSSARGSWAMPEVSGSSRASVRAVMSTCVAPSAGRSVESSRPSLIALTAPCHPRCLLEVPTVLHSDSLNNTQLLRDGRHQNIRITRTCAVAASVAYLQAMPLETHSLHTQSHARRHIYEKQSRANQSVQYIIWSGMMQRQLSGWVQHSRHQDTTQHSIQITVHEFRI